MSSIEKDIKTLENFVRKGESLPASEAEKLLASVKELYSIKLTLVEKQTRLLEEKIKRALEEKGLPEHVVNAFGDPKYAGKQIYLFSEDELKQLNEELRDCERLKMPDFEDAKCGLEHLRNTLEYGMDLAKPKVRTKDKILKEVNKLLEVISSNGLSSRKNLTGRKSKAKQPG